MTIKSAVEAYRQSAYQGVEYRISTAIGAASLPVIGGFKANLQAIGNSIARPFKVTKALVAGGHYPVDHIVEAQIPEDVQKTPYADGLAKMREYGRISADKRTEAFQNLLRLHFTDFFREDHVAGYNDRQIQRVVMPGEAKGPIDGALDKIFEIGAGLAKSTLASQNASPVSLGNLVVPMLSPKIVSGLPKLQVA